MPQMMPMSWLTLFTTFSATLIMFTSMNYYMKIPKTNKPLKEHLTTKTVNWKW
uniref:ATP synthase complex subunit 8 n=1 Tax=Neotermes fulvescens TaxID=2942695 RepID=A0A8X8M3A0_9NEOP|nr:ATP synthase F0 subunit 8 [Neotermes fulvescens]